MITRTSYERHREAYCVAVQEADRYAAVLVDPDSDDIRRDARWGWAIAVRTLIIDFLKRDTAYWGRGYHR